MIERISPDNPLTERHVGMMAVLRDKGVCGPIEHATGNGDWCIWVGSDNWHSDGRSEKTHYDGSDIIAVLPMPDLSELGEGE